LVNPLLPNEQIRNVIPPTPHVTEIPSGFGDQRGSTKYTCGWGFTWIQTMCGASMGYLWPVGFHFLVPWQGLGS